jgi:hypothetical protein
MRRFIRKYFALFIISALFGIIATLSAAYNVIEFTISSKNDTTLIKVITDNKPQFSDSLLQNPDRLVIDFENGIQQFVSPDFKKMPAGLVMSVRTSQYKTQPKVARVVIDLSEPIKNYRTTALADGLEIRVPTVGYPVIEKYKSGRKAKIPLAPQEKTLQDKKALAKTEEEKGAEGKTKASPEKPQTAPKDTTKKTKGETIEEFVIPQAEGIVADTARKAYYVRSKIVYETMQKRDPFQAVLTTKKSEMGKVAVPNIENLKLVGIIGKPGDFNALLQDDRGFGYIFSLGDSVSNGDCVAISDTSLTFRINEYGYIRDVTITMIEAKDEKIH